MVRQKVLRLIFASFAIAFIATGCKTTKGAGDEAGGAGAGGEGTSGRHGVSVEEVGVPTELLKTVYFDYDRSEIRDDAKETLKGNAAAIKENTTWKQITIQGHCDERGSEEYNLALGERRANSVKKYLVALGVSDARIVTISFGESVPAVDGHTEDAWSKNRRGEFSVK